MRDVVFLLWRAYEVERVENLKLLGVFTTHEFAEAAHVYFRKQREFRNQLDGFRIDEVRVNRHLWSEGFISLKGALEKLP